MPTRGASPRALKKLKSCDGVRSFAASFLVNGDVDRAAFEVNLESVAGEGEGHAVLHRADVVGEFGQQCAEFLRRYPARLFWVVHTCDVLRFRQ